MPFEPSYTNHSVTMTPSEITAKADAIAEAHNPAPPIAPANAQDARRRLDTLIADQAWGARLLSGDAEATR